jgi:predicted enzyme related to lactoylglutathione lyase
MVKLAAHPPGAFCFIEAGSADLEVSHRFYKGLFGWEVEERSLPNGGRYTRFLMQGRPVAGMYGVAHQGVTAVPSQWLSYVSVEDAVATLNTAVRFGATPFGDVVEVPGVVTVAEFVDPAGAVCGLWQPGTHIGASYVGEPGTLTWNELLTPDPGAAASFYCNVFGWTHETEELPSGRYHFFKSGDTLRGGMAAIGPGMRGVSPWWRPHLGVSDLVAAISTVAELGGSVNEDPLDSGLRRRTVVRDSVGLDFMLIESTPHH